ncbi:STAS/SEC14 domain-containing protein [Planctomicrobium sp. SH661]|uniref:STAS/SEC14 domain-containing protein n=1 Tax=Planctomicrobium sp. SH661 TaxID=3448124 RepID=UPI003F5B0455
MAVEVKEVPESKLVEVHLTGKLTKEDYLHFVPIVEKHIQEQGKLRLLVVMHDFHGWTAGALWQDMKFDSKHFKDIERLAIVGESKWEQGMASFCKPFTSASIKYFDHSKLAEAQEWAKGN